MCGICGVASHDPLTAPIDELRLRCMTDVIAHRGPDDEGHHRAAGVALGMRRLSVIDVIDPASSRQPVSNENGSVLAVFNGEIYNFRQLRADLTRRGHRFASEGDGETIVHLYEEHGARFAEHLRGMFAIALWDADRRRLVLARDRMGVKPLYITQGEFGLAFASEVKSLIAGGLVNPALDPLAAELFMAHGYVPGPRTLFGGVAKLAPATVLVWEHGQPADTFAYWSPFDGAVDRAGATWEEDQEQLIDVLGQAVRDRMVSDVPLGVMLSGGLDSSLITALMAQASAAPIKTFSIGFQEDAAANELDDARSVAQRLGTDHHELLTSAVDHPELLDEALWHIEEPVADLSGLGFLLLSRLARESVTVALSGQGADEILGGYRKHQIAAAAGPLARTPRALRAMAGRAARLAGEGSTTQRGVSALTATDPAERLLAMSRIVQAHDRPALFTADFLQPGAEAEIAASITRQLSGRALSPLAETLHLDARLALVDNMLLYFDKMSMAASLEVRVPFMDHDVVSFCVSLPDSRRVWRTRRKEVLKRASRGLVDDAIIDKKKQGFFHAALGAWVGAHRETLFEEILLDERTRRRGFYRADALVSLIDAAGTDGKKADQRLFCLLLLEKWQRLFVDPGSPGQRLRADSAAQCAVG